MLHTSFILHSKTIFLVVQEWPGSGVSPPAQISTARDTPDKAAADTQSREGEESQGSDVAETLGLWWHGHFVQAGRGGSGYTSFASEVKV